MLTKSKDILINARKNGYAIPAFNFENMEMAKTVISECKKLNSPVILQTTPSTLNYIFLFTKHIISTSLFSSPSIIPGCTTNT